MATYNLRREGGVVGKTSGGGGLPSPAGGGGLTTGGLGTRRGCDVHWVVDPVAGAAGDGEDGWQWGRAAVSDGLARTRASEE